MDDLKTIIEMNASPLKWLQKYFVPVSSSFLSSSRSTATAQFVFLLAIYPPGDVKQIPNLWTSFSATQWATALELVINLRMHIKRAMVLSNRFKAAAIGLLASATSFVAADVCSSLEEKGIPVDKPPSPAFVGEQFNYWSQACSDMRPTCIVALECAEQVAKTVAALRETTDLFTVKSGGHIPKNQLRQHRGGDLDLDQEFKPSDL